MNRLIININLNYHYKERLMAETNIMDDFITPYEAEHLI